jgi:hypothetical protein
VHGDHTNIVAVLDIGRLEGGPYDYYIDMELCDFNLSKYIAGEFDTAFQGLDLVQGAAES